MELSLNLLLCIILCIIFSTSSSSLAPLCHDNERTALLQFKLSFSLSKAASSSPLAYPKTQTWNSTGEGGDCCLWDGIECDVKSGHVVTLDLRSSLLYGFINPDSTIFNLVHLELLDLSDNNFRHSPIPPALDTTSGASLLKLDEAGLVTLVRNLTSLEILGLNQVQISTRVPTIISNLTRLTSLYLRDCGFYGQVPEGIFMLPNLQLLSLSGNGGLVGSLPEFHNSSNLQELHLARTGFSGQIPHSINNLDSLVNLDISNCSFQGQIPNSLGDLTKLSYIDLSYNNFSGQIPNSLGDLTKLSFIDLSFNKFSGQIPNSFANLTGLSHFNLRDNQLTGDIPSYLGNFSDLNYLNLWDNAFTGFLSIQRNLEVLYLDGNKISGPIPGWFCNVSRESLLLLNLRQNLLTDFPEGCSPLPWVNLNALDLSSNGLSGRIPPCLGDLGNTLEFLSLAGNNLRGTIPDTFPKTCRLQYLSLDHNQLQGEDLLLGSNRLNGQIDFQSANLFPQLRILDLSGNSFTGPLPRRYSVCRPLYPQLQICWDDPGTHGNLVGLQSLNLSYNNFIGAIPRTFASLSNVEVMDLSHNMLSGEIPQQLAGLTMLAMFNVSYNNLTGTISHGNQFNTFENDSFAGNTGLCGFPLSTVCGDSDSPSPSEEEEGDEDSWTLVDWIIISLGYVAGLVVGLIFGRILTGKYHEWFVEMFGRRRRKKRRNKPVN
ncbi:hypothetical protein Dimus_034191 [Dionaea muscipula]